MACGVNPPSLLNSPRHLHIMDNPSILETDMDHSIPSFDFLGQFQGIQWDASVQEPVSASEKIFSEAKTSPIRSSESNKSDSYYDCDPFPIGDSSKTQPCELPHTESRSRKRGNKAMHSVRDKYSHLKDGHFRQSKRRHSQPRKLSPASSLGEDFGLGGDQKSCRLEKNRVAATKCRQKKKRETSKLQERERQLTAQRNGLKSMVDALRMEVLCLRHEILKHGMCECPVIQKYIAESARQIA
ncbi:hypothetical protein M426DRAFT_11459 [Hypoxylon sp. CI-4A]|nr:hypothetical protein M426DRAFT_11459 [Hypoxylon sp. CI-4A]